MRKDGLVSGVFDEIGPVLVSRAALHAQARELLELAQRAVEFAGTGPTANRALAERQIERMRAVLAAPLVAAEPGAVSAAEVLAWMKARQSESWVRSAADVEIAIGYLDADRDRGPGAERPA